MKTFLNSFLNLFSINGDFFQCKMWKEVSCGTPHHPLNSEVLFGIYNRILRLRGDLLRELRKVRTRREVRTKKCSDFFELPLFQNKLGSVQKMRKHFSLDTAQNVCIFWSLPLSKYPWYPLVGPLVFIEKPHVLPFLRKPRVPPIPWPITNNGNLEHVRTFEETLSDTILSV